MAILQRFQLPFDMPPAPATCNLYMQRHSSNAQTKFVNPSIGLKQINADLKRTQRKHCDINSRDVRVPEGKRVYVRLPPSRSTEKGAATRIIRRYDEHGRQDLLHLRHLTTDKQLGAMSIEKIIVVPDDIVPDD